MPDAVMLNSAGKKEKRGVLRVGTLTEGCHGSAQVFLVNALTYVVVTECGEIQLRGSIHECGTLASFSSFLLRRLRSTQAIV
jgi:hypothetical protein